jgi:hypothetical protein
MFMVLFSFFFRCSRVLLFCFLLLSASNLWAKEKREFSPDSLTGPSLSRKLTLVYSGMGASYLGSMFLLNELWYKDYPRSSFHSFNDNREWLQVDKVGHFGSSWYLSMLGMHFLRGLDAPKRQEILIGGGAGLIYLTTIEVLDGFSSNWGFSTGDMLANLGGSLFATSQSLIWDEQKIKVKFSYHNHHLAPLRPNVLGASLPQRLFKDYSSQTYWLSFSPFNFCKREKLKKWSWACIALGYGGRGMLGAIENKFVSQGVDFDYSHIPREREFLLSLDIDLTKVPIRKKWYRNLTTVFCLLKIPAPAFVWNQKSLALKAFY